MLPQRFYPTLGSVHGLRRDLNRLFDEWSDTFDALSPFRTRSFPAVNVWEDDEHAGTNLGMDIQDWGGMRCEDNIVVTEEGVEILSEFPRTLVG